MPTPSLLIVPARWKTGSPGKLYSQIPTDGSGDFSVTGVITGSANAGTRVNNLGYIEAVTTSGTPRLDYFASGGVVGCPALLVEPIAENLCKYSEQFDTVTSGWLTDNLLTITGNTNATLDPAGGNTADLIVATTGTTTHDIRPNANNFPSFVSGTTYTYSVFAKATSTASGFLQLYFGAIGFSPSSPFANFQLSGNGAITVGNYSAATIQPFGNGWYRCSITVTAAASGSGAAVIMPILASGTIRDGNFSGNGVDGVYLWGAQLETGSVATSYIPTTTAAVTRNADVISVSGAVSGSIGQTEGTLYAEVTFAGGLTNRPSRHIFEIGDGTDNNRVVYYIDSNTTNIIGFIQASGSFVFNSGASFAGVASAKLALAYKSGDYALYVNGSVAASGTTAFSFGTTMNQVTIGSRHNFVAQLNDRIRAAALYTTRLSNDELMLLTMPGNNTYLPQAIWEYYLDSRAGNTEIPDCLYTRHVDLIDV